MFSYIFFRISVFIFKLLPFPVVYSISNVLAFILKDIIRYRKSVVTENLKNSFPEKSEKEIKKITRKFYLHLTDISLESIKGFSLSDKNILKRYVLKNKEVKDTLFDHNNKIIYVSGHFGNWEWGTRGIPLNLKDEVYILYKPLKNKRIDNFVEKKRSQNNAKLLSIYHIGKEMLMKQTSNMTLLMLGDQNPSNVEKAIWINFLNKPTACLHGLEMYSKKLDLPVIYISINKVKRGYYELLFEMLIEKPKDELKGQITLKYMKKVEQDIIKKPENWLWSHKRWKHKYDENKYKLVR